jgi:hypothetical protein
MRAGTGLDLFRTGRRARLVRRFLPTPTASAGDREFARLAGLRSFGDPILDVGTGRDPGWLAALRRVGYRHAVGIDPDGAESGTVDGALIRRVALAEVRETFQAVTFHHTFEGMADPVGTIAAAVGRLRPRGAIVIRTSVFGTWFWDRFGTSWSDLDAARHRFVHTRASIERLAALAGLRVDDVVWESTFLELVASTQIARDIAWLEPGSWRVDPPGPFSPEIIDRFRLQAAALNAAGAAGRAAFYLRRVDDPPARPRPATRAGATPGKGGAARAGRQAPPPAARLDEGVRELVRTTARRSEHTRRRLNLVIPAADPAMAFGGVRTAVDAFLAMATGGIPIRIVSLAPVDPATAESLIPGSIVAAASDDPDHHTVFTAVDGGRGDSLAIGPNDVFVATFWTTADLVHRIRAWQRATFGSAPDRFGYIIQDDEVGFYPRSAQSVLAAATYEDRAATIAIYNTAILRDHFHASGIVFDHEFVFEARLPRALRPVRSASGVPRDQRIVAYGRPRTPRNAFPLVVEGLRAWREIHPGAADWSVVSAGQDHPDVDLGGDRWLRSIGKLDLAAYADLLRGSAVGLSLMISPHPSYPPLEMAHLGMLVLTNRFGVKDLSTWHDNIESLESIDALAIGRQLAGLCARFEGDPRVGEAGATHHPDYLAEDDQFPFAAKVVGLLGFPQP